MTEQEKYKKGYETLLQIIQLIGESAKSINDKKEVLTHVGTLTSKQGIKGFKTMEISDSVFEKGDRYILVMETIDGKSCSEISYYKESLKPVINFEI